MNKSDYTNMKYTNNRNYYADGSAARQIQELPHNNDYQENLVVLPQQKKRKKQKARPGVDFTSFLVLSASIITLFYSCVSYLQVQSSITTMNKEISILESNLTKMTSENDVRESIIETSMDLKYIYQVATNELGMVYPQDNQVIDYESIVSDYVRQYGDIPAVKEETVVDRIFK